MAINTDNNSTVTNAYAAYASGTNSKLQDAAKDSAQELSDRFMALLIAQMRNQDPLEPMDNSQMTSQMAQISTVSGINQLNTTMEWLGYSMASLQSTQAAGLIGRDMLAPGDDLRITESISQATGGYHLPQDVVKGSIIVKNQSGVEVARISLEQKDLSEGMHTFQWDGKDSQGNAVSPGKYSFQVLASDGTTEAALTTFSVAKITAVQPDAGGTMVMDQYGNRSRLIDVMQIM